MSPPSLALCRLPAATLGLPCSAPSLPRPRLFLAARRARAVAARASSSSSPDSSFGSRMEESVKITAADNPVVIYSKSWCSYSMEVKALFKRIGVQPHVIELDHLVKAHGHANTPAIEQPLAPLHMLIRLLPDTGHSFPYVIYTRDLGPQGPQLQKVLERLTGQFTVPNVFIGGKHIGGCTDTVKLYRKGELATMLSELDISVNNS